MLQTSRRIEVVEPEQDAPAEAAPIVLETLKALAMLDAEAEEEERRMLDHKDVVGRHVAYDMIDGEHDLVRLPCGQQALCLHADMDRAVAQHFHGCAECRAWAAETEEAP